MASQAEIPQVISASSPEKGAGHQAEDNPAPRLYTKGEAAALLRCTVSWLEKRAAKRLIPFTMLGGAYRFSDEHLAEIIRLNEQRPVAMDKSAPSGSKPRRRSRRTPPAQPSRAPLLRPRPRPIPDQHG
jgi:excisionase family DNA binding protein